MNNRFTLICQRYDKDGCPGPVTVFDVYDKEAHAQRYVVASDAGFTWQSMDAIEPIDLQPDIEFEEITLGGWCWSELTCEPSYDQHKFTDEEFELFKYCQFEHYKIDCNRRDYRASLPIDELPKELADGLLDDFVNQHRDNGWKVTTDGFEIYPHDSYVSKVLKQRRERLQETKDFTAWFDSIPYAYDHSNSMTTEFLQSATLTVGGRVLQIPLHADSHTTISSMLHKIIDEE